MTLNELKKWVDNLVEEHEGNLNPELRLLREDIPMNEISLRLVEENGYAKYIILIC